MPSFRYNRLINKETTYLKIFTIPDIFKVVGGSIVIFAVSQSMILLGGFLVGYVAHAIRFRLNEPAGAFQHWLEYQFRAPVRRPGHSEAPHPIDPELTTDPKPPKS